MTGQTYQANEVFTLRNHPAGRIQPRNGPVLARGPYVWHPWSKAYKLRDCKTLSYYLHQEHFYQVMQNPKNYSTFLMHLRKFCKLLNATITWKTGDWSCRKPSLRTLHDYTLRWLRNWLWWDCLLLGKTERQPLRQDFAFIIIYCLLNCVAPTTVINNPYFCCRWARRAPVSIAQYKCCGIC